MEQLDSVGPLLRKYHGEFGYLSLLGIKDLVMTSTAQPLPLLHVVPSSQANTNLDPSAYFMFCLTEHSPFFKELQHKGVQFSATASIISNIEGSQWEFIMSNEI